jgi:flagellar P-ring protein precursor FlgI
MSRVMAVKTGGITAVKTGRVMVVKTRGVTAVKSIVLCAALLALVALALAAGGAAWAGPARVADLTVHPGSTPRRLVGYGLVVGLDGTGDRATGGLASQTPSVKSIVNVLRRFGVEVPPDRLRPRNVAAVLVTAELSPYLRAGGRFEVQVSAIGDATSLHGGVLWMTPLAAGPDDPVVASAQGPIWVAMNDETSSYYRRANAGRISEGGILETEPPAAGAPDSLLVLRSPDLVTAQRIAAAVDLAFGAGTARVRDPGAVALLPGAGRAAEYLSFLAAVDTVMVTVQEPARVIIDARDGTLVAGGGLRVGPASVTHRGITLQIGGSPLKGDVAGLVRVDSRAAIEDVAAGLHAAGARAEDMVAIFEALRAAGALQAQVVVR